MNLTIKMISPLLIMGIMGIGIWVYSLIMLPQDDKAIESIAPKQAQQRGKQEEKIPLSTISSTSEYLLETVHSSIPAPSIMQPVSSSHRHAPETPLPQTRPSSETLKCEGETPTILPSRSLDGQQALVVDQKSEHGVVGGVVPFAPEVPLPNISQPMPLASGPLPSSDPLISLRLLKDVSMTINVPGDGHIVVPLTLNAKRVQLLAYIAWRRGELIDRDKILEHVFGWGLSDEDATEDKLTERFESHKKLLRRKLREVVVKQVNNPAGREIISPDLDPFVSDSGFWGLSDICRVEDLEAIEANYKVISLARKDGMLIDEIPEYVKDACEQVITNYAGDFLESLIRKYPSEFRAWQGRSSWVRKPYTQYRDYYLDALWYSAEYDWRMGQRYADDGDMETKEANQRKQQEYFGRAAQKYQSYAMYACNSKFDAKATFGAHGQFGERIGMSERALRRCVVLLGAIGRTDLVNQVWSAYYTQMKSVSDQRWQPSKETQDDVQAAKAQTSAYRFAAQVAQMSSEFAERRDRVS